MEQTAGNSKFVKKDLTLCDGNCGNYSAMGILLIISLVACKSFSMTLEALKLGERRRDPIWSEQHRFGLSQKI